MASEIDVPAVPSLTSSCIHCFWGNSVLQLPSPVLSTHGSCPGPMAVPTFPCIPNPRQMDVSEQPTTNTSPSPWNPRTADAAS